MKPFIFCYICMLAATTSFAQDTLTVNYNDIHDRRVKIIGQLGKPFGTIVTVKGVLVDYFSKRGDSGPNLIVQMINDSATQQFIRIPIKALWGLDENAIAKLQFGATYKFRVFEEGRYTGTPPGIYERTQSAPQVVSYDTTQDGHTTVTVPGYVPQASPVHFQNFLLATDWEKTEQIPWHPEQFFNKKGLLTGIAKNEGDTAIVEQGALIVKLPGLKKWSDNVTGQNAEVYGVFKNTAKKDIYILAAGWAQPVKLQQQVSQVVKLRGEAVQLNGYWWFNYRGTDIYIENMDKLPEWKTHTYSRLIEITGLLEKNEKKYAGRIFEYTIKNASWALTDDMFLLELLYYKESVIY